MTRRLLVWPAVFVLLVAAALGLGALPAPTGGPEGAGPARHAVFVVSNGFHAGIALPADARIPAANGRTAGTVMSVVGLDAAAHPVDAGAVRYWLFGWGSLTAYTSLRAVSDLTPAIAARALAFDETVMHVQPLGPLAAPARGVYRLDLTDAQLATLTGAIARSFASTEPLPQITQGFGDRFFAGRGRFAPWSSCNAWVGRRLREAGIGVGVWTPLAQTLEFGLARLPAGQAR